MKKAPKKLTPELDNKIESLFQLRDNRLHVKLPEPQTVSFTFRVSKSKKPKKKTEFDRICDHVEDIMREHGPDGHTDGSGIITRYILYLLRKERAKKK
jgi:hypothetical protein